jgi:DNA-binding HxlR family transcriptional regulator
MTDSTTLSEDDFNTKRIGDISCDQIRSEGTAILGLFDLLSRSRALEVLAQFADDAGPWRFNELETQLGIPPNTLTRRLKELEEYGLLTREIQETVPPHVEYTATTSAIELQPVLQYLYLWANRPQN